MLPFKRESNDDKDDHEDIRYRMICDKQKEEKDDNNNDIYVTCDAKICQEYEIIRNTPSHTTAACGFGVFGYLHARDSRKGLS